MTMDRTLKVHGGLVRTRSVLTRAERIARLSEEGNFDPEKDSPYGLPKTKVRHSKAGTKTRKVEEPKPEEIAAAGEAAQEGAAPAKAAAAKGAAAKGAPAKPEKPKAEKGKGKGE